MSPLSALPRPSERRVAVRVTRDALRQLRGGHPWVFDRSITSVSHEADPGDLAVVFDDKRRFAGIGLWDPASPIRLRVLHQGSPMTIDDSFWQRRLAEALERRAPLADDEGTDAYRCIHGENDAMPGLVLDRYGSNAVLKLYTAAWIPHLPDIVGAIAEQLDPERLVVRFARAVPEHTRSGLGEGTSLIGDAAGAPVRFRENGLVMEADLVHGHKTGHFLDQRENRDRVRTLAARARVLDVFACTGGFTLNAAAGGATSVHAVDISAPALATLRRNVELNQEDASVRSCAVTTSVGDAFDVLDTLVRSGDRFDLVVVDPPSFASRDADVQGALASYRRLTRLAATLLEPGGVLVQSSCSSRVGSEAFFGGVGEAVGRVGRRFEELERTGHALDHPIGFAQGAYLKTVFGEVV